MRTTFVEMRVFNDKEHGQICLLYGRAQVKISEGSKRKRGERERERKGP